MNPKIGKRADIEIDRSAGRIVVKGVPLTRHMLAVYLDQLGGIERNHLCNSCGETYRKLPAKCAKCGASSFAEVCVRLTENL